MGVGLLGPIGGALLVSIRVGVLKPTAPTPNKD